MLCYLEKWNGIRRICLKGNEVDHLAGDGPLG